MRPLLALALLSSGQAGSRWLVNDGYDDGEKAWPQQGFIANECWGVVYLPDAGDYPFDMRKVRMLVGGSTATDLFTVEFYSLDGTDMNDGTLLGAEGVAISGSDQAWNDLTISELKIDLPAIDSGNVAVAVCLEEHDGLPAIMRDDDGMSDEDLNWINADLGGTWAWYRSAEFGLRGDWIMRLCIEGDDVPDENCLESDSDADADADTDTDADGDSDADTDAGDLDLLSITPATAPAGEAVDVVLLGSGFGGGAEARIGGVAIVGQDIVNAETISGRTPSVLPEGTHDVEVVMDGESAVLIGGFEVTGGSADAGGEKGGCGCAAAQGRGTGLLGLLVAMGGWAAGRRRGLSRIRAACRSTGSRTSR